MGRRKVIDRNFVLDVAETIVSERGASRFTIEAVAAAAGITKGGVQSCFASKEAMIEAMLHRWTLTYSAAFDAKLGESTDPIRRVKARMAVTAESTSEANARSASLLVNLLQSPDHLSGLREWYKERLEGLDTSSQAGIDARLAFFATEGAFFLRFFGLMDLESDWDNITTQIAGIMEGNSKE